MSDFVRLCSKADLPEDGEAKEITLGDKVICVASVNGTISAMDNVCLHRGGPLGQGSLDGQVVMCPWHAWTYDVTTGVSTVSPELSVPRYDVKLEGGEVFVSVE